LTSLSSNGTTIPGTHSWTLSGKALVAAATYVVRITVTDGLKPSSIDLTITVGQENAYIDYTGDTIAQVGTSLALRATVWDSAAAGYTGTNPETGTNATIGDITKMWIEFDIYPAASCGSVTPTILRAQVLDSGTLRDGIGTATASYKSSSEASFCVIPVLVASSTGGTNQYYVSTLGGEAAGLDFYVNTGQFATGGGWISDPTGSKGNFGFNARYANNNSPKGQLVYVYRGMYNGVPADFIIKSNALNGLKFSTGNYPITATLQGKANIQINQASNGAQLYGDGNATFSITATDSGQTTTGDALSLTVYDKNAVPYKTIVTSALKGGNLVVHTK
jgi:hypothetical protein